MDLGTNDVNLEGTFSMGHFLHELPPPPFVLKKKLRTTTPKIFFACGEHTNITALLFLGAPPEVLTSNYGDFGGLLRRF